MKTTRLIAPGLAVAALLAIVACEATPPATPEPTPGPLASSSALNGVYNLRASDCGAVGSQTGLTIDGNRFNFPASSCVVANSESKVGSTEVTLNCDNVGNRVVQLQTRENVLRVTEDQTTLTYYQCERAPASSDALVGTM